MKDDTSISFGYGYAFSDNMPKYILGRMLTIIDSLGLRESQEKAVKDLIVQAFWRDIEEYAVYISPEIYTAIKVFINKDREEQTGKPHGFPYDVPRNLKVVIEKITK